MSLRMRNSTGLGTIEPCLPSPAKAPPSAQYKIIFNKKAAIKISEVSNARA
jgi:hypothetical protein